MTPYLVLAAGVAALLALGEVVRSHLARERQLGGHGTSIETSTSPAWSFFDVLAIISLVTFSGIRYDIGTDYGLYAVIYEALDTTDWSEAVLNSPQEAGFTLLMLGLRTVWPSPIALFWATSLLTVVPAYVAIKQVSARPVLGVLLYILFAFYLTPFNLVRQGMAISLVFFATTCLRRRPIWFAAVCAVAVSIHVSTIVVLAVMWLTHRRRPSFPTVGILAAATAGAALALNRFAGFGELVGRLNPRYEQFLESSEGAGLGTALQVFALLLLLAYAAILGRQDTEVARTTGWLVLLTLIGVSLMILSTQALPFGRLAFFFTIYLVVLLPERVAASRTPIVHDLVLVTVGLAFYILHLAFYGGLVPYQTILG